MTNDDQGKDNTGADGVKLLEGFVMGPIEATMEDAPVWYNADSASGWANGYNSAIANIDTDAIAALVGAAQMMVRAYRHESDQTIHAFYALEAALARLGGGE